MQHIRGDYLQGLFDVLLHVADAKLGLDLGVLRVNYGELLRATLNLFVAHCLCQIRLFDGSERALLQLLVSAEVQVLFKLGEKPLEDGDHGILGFHVLGIGQQEGNKRYYVVVYRDVLLRLVPYVSYDLERVRPLSFQIDVDRKKRVVVLPVDPREYPDNVIWVALLQYFNYPTPSLVRMVTELLLLTALSDAAELSKYQHPKKVVEHIWKAD